MPQGGNSARGCWIATAGYLTHNARMHEHRSRRWSAWSEWLWSDEYQQYYRVRVDANGHEDYEFGPDPGQDQNQIPRGDELDHLTSGIEGVQINESPSHDGSLGTDEGIYTTKLRQDSVHESKGRHHGKEKERGKDQAKEKGKEKGKEKTKDKEKEKKAERGKDKEREREKEKEKGRHKEKDRSKGKDKGKGRENEEGTEWDTHPSGQTWPGGVGQSDANATGKKIRFQSAEERPSSRGVIFRQSPQQLSRRLLLYPRKCECC